MKYRSILTGSALLFVCVLSIAFLQNNKEESNPFVLEKDLRYDGPAKYAAMHNYIRTREGEDLPRYTTTSKTEALKKAQSQLSYKRDDLEWIERGPANVGGRTRGLIIDPSDDTHRTWFAGSVGGGVWKTENAGRDWTLLTPDIPNLATSTLAMSPNNTDVIYAGTGEGFPNFESIAGSGMWKSVDGGDSWEVLSSTQNDRFGNVMRLAINPENENEILAATRNPVTTYILKSLDGGETWETKFEADFQAVQHLVAAEQDFSLQYASINGSGLMKSTDTGETWTQVFDASVFGIRRMEIAISPNNSDVVYLSCESDEGSILIYSFDGFQTWERSIYPEYPANWLSSQGWYDNTIAVHPYNDSIVWVAGAGPILELRLGTETGSFAVFDGYENLTEFIEPVAEAQFTDEPIGLSRDLFTGLPVQLEITGEDIVDVEIRFGPGISSKAHLVDVDLYTFGFTYNSMVDVPFQAWDSINNRQLAMSVFDTNGDGEWSLIDVREDPYAFTDVLFVNALDYSETADPVIEAGNATYKSLYYLFVQPSETWVDSTTTDFPEGKITIDTRLEEGIISDFVPIADGYFEYTDVAFVGTKGVHVDHHNLVFVPIDSTTQSFYVLNANDGGVAFSEDSGETFVQTGDTFEDGSETLDGYNASQFYGIDKKNGESRYVGGTQDNGSWVSGVDPLVDSQWATTPGGDGFEAAWNYDNTDLLLETSQFNGLYKSTNEGATWNFVPLPGGEGPFFSRIGSSQMAADLVFMVAEEGVLRSEDFADSWEVIEMPEGWEFNSLWGPPVRISHADPSVVWSGHRLGIDQGVAVSQDSGRTFNITEGYPDAFLGPIVNIETDPFDPNTAYAIMAQADGPKILKTSDLGQSWEDITGFITNEDNSSNGFPDVATYSMIVMPFDTDIIWAGTEIGIFESQDAGKSWQILDNGFPAAAVYQMKIVNDELVVATHGRGIWTLDINQLINTSTEDLTIESVEDIKVYPNPMDQLTTFTFNNLETQNLRVDLIDASGRVVRNVFRGVKNQGVHNLSIERADLQAGQYYIMLSNAEGRISQKLILI